MSALQEILGLVVSLLEFAFRRGSRLWPINLLAMVVIFAILYARSSRSTSFLKWAFPKSTYLHQSHKTDIKLFFFSQVLTIFGFFKLVAVTTAVATAVAEFGDDLLPNGPSLGLIPMTLVLIMAADFTTYWVHRSHHETPALWPFHSVHHSAEVMTPMTLNRKHPVYDIISIFSKGIVGGVAQGLLLAVFVDNISFSTIASVNAGYFLFNILGANLRHTHIWLSYGRRLEHLFISPAQHQIHHSIRPEHFNKNYGEVFALWDWMFGTLFVTEGPEELQFGLCDGSGVPIEQPHTSLRRALVVPLQDSWRSIRGQKPAASSTDSREPSVTGVAP